ncbi:uncharacterized protein N0V89_008943 [Didymosphaeria variabile]|uniref:Peptidase metallopeptidase domain-containing protein n=1 Tax=Didymosphaeria variabile TaxID=1932322 RepID=A0A9W8XHQ6_9PLEO|nr:uncharacterized protein N0V89_008943 [Didymosphaeria variabile]KAJ4350322.1 hypothetical protein N0V89_008943 [Didymosphaeria variabile]
MACLAYGNSIDGPGVTTENQIKTNPATQSTYNNYVLKVGNIRWNDGETLHVGFRGGTPWQRQTVASIAVQWTYHANISFRFDTDGKGQERYDILVSFDTTNKASWSKIGNTSRDSAAAGSPSMNLGDLNQFNNDAYNQRTILHEFGHALGRKHMHQSPWREEHPSVAFDREKVYAHYYQNQGWDRNKVDLNILAEADLDWTQITERMRMRMMDLVMPKFDMQSIMMYPFDASLMLGGQGGTQRNFELSAWDKYAISKAYPYHP